MLVPRPRQPLLLLGALLVATVAAGLGGISAYRKVVSFQPVGITALRAGGSWRVESVGYPETGLRVGDAILLVDGTAPATAAELDRRLLARPHADLLLARDGAPQTVRYSRPPLDIDGAYLLLALTGLIYLVIGFYTLTRATHGTGRLFFLWCVVSASVYLLTTTYPLDSLGRIAYGLEELARIALPALTLHLFLSFPAPIWSARRQRAAVGLAYIPALVLAAVQLDLMLFDGRLIAGGASSAILARQDRIELFHLVGLAMVSLTILVARLYGREPSDERRQLLWIAAGLAGGYLPFALLYVLPFAAGLRPTSALELVAVAPLVFVPLSFAYAILRYRLWDLGILVRNGLSYVVTLVIGASAFALAQHLLAAGLLDATQGFQQLVSGATGLLVAGVMLPTHRAVRGGLEKLYYFSSWERRRALVEYGRHLLQTRDLGDLQQELLAELEDTLSLTPVDLVVLDDGETMVAVRDPGSLSGAPLDLDPEVWGTDVAQLSPFGLPQTGDTLSKLLYGHGYRYLFPLVARGKRLGFLICGHRDGDLPLSSEDLDLVRAYLNQAVLAIENAKLMTALRARLDEVVRLQRHNQGIIERSPAGIVVIDQDDVIRSSNQTFRSLVGRSELDGLALTEILPVQPLPTPADGLVEVSFSDAGHRERYLQLSIADHEQQDGGFRILVVHDVSERVALENTLREQERLAALGMLAAGVAHEVNTPITGISSYAQMLLERTSPDDERFELLTKIERQTFRAASIVNSLLDFARDRGEQRQPVTLTKVLEDTLRMLSERLAEQRVDLRWTPDPSLPAISANPGEIEQVFTNLLLNAIDAVAEGGTIEVSVRANDQRVVARVADNGRGIEKEDLERIFRPFYSTKLKSGGTGLGLSISYQIVRRHGGEIRVQSEPGKGTTFEVELPLTTGEKHAT